MKKPKFIVEFDDIPTPRAKMRELDLEERHLNFDEVELGLTREDALREASRCLSCRRCIGCGLCLAECDRDAIVYDSEPETTRLRVDAVVLATGLEPFDAARTGKLGYQTGMNIVTSVELERILSPTGPYGGLPLRPGDGTFPKRIAFVQCVGSREEGIGADFCASTCCNEAMSLALQLSDRLDRASVTIFHRELRPFGKTGEKLEVLVEGSTRIETIPAEIESIAGDDCTGPVTVTYDRGDGSTQSEFDLVVLSIGRRASRSSRSVARKVRADTDRFGFLQTAGLSAASSTAGGIYVAGQCGGPTGLRQALASAAAAASAVTASLGPVTRDAAAPDPDGRLDPEMPPDGEAAGAIIVALCEYGLGELGEPVESVRRSVEGADGVTAVHTSRFACARRPVVELGHLLKENGAERVVVIGCRTETHSEFWRSKATSLGLEASSVQLIGAENGDSKAAIESAIRTERSARSEPSPGPQEPREQRVLVLGGGPSGLAAADELASHCVAVTLVESMETLGGPVSGELVRDADLKTELDALAERVTSSAATDVLLGSTVTITSGNGQGISARIAGQKKSVGQTYGAVIVTEGTQAYDASGHRAEGAGSIVTQDELAKKLNDAAFGPKSVVMIQCVGSRSREHPYCSRTCCRDALTNALVLKSRSPETEVTILHRGIRVWDVDEGLLSDAIDQGVSFVRVSEDPSISTESGLSVSATDTGEGGTMSLKSELLVLSVGVVPAATNKTVSEALGVRLNNDGFFEPASGLSAPVESERAGVFIGGTASGPVSLSEGVARARAAAGKAWLFLKRGDNGA